MNDESAVDTQIPGQFDLGDGITATLVSKNYSFFKSDGFKVKTIVYYMENSIGEGDHYYIDKLLIDYVFDIASFIEGELIIGSILLRGTIHE